MPHQEDRSAYYRGKAEEAARAAYAEARSEGRQVRRPYSSIHLILSQGGLIEPAA
jgi:hypothetical protein